MEVTRFHCSKCDKEFALSNDTFITTVMPRCIYCGNNKYVEREAYPDVSTEEQKRKVAQHGNT